MSMKFFRFFTSVRPLLRFSCSEGHPSRPVLTLFTKKNEQCSLCEEAKEILSKYSDRFTYREVYIDDPSNREWFEKYQYHIPVIHINGDYLMKHRINEQLLQRTLASYSKE